LNDFGPIPEVQEDGQSFEENAYKKARFTPKFLGLPALADDSGLEVEALEERPAFVPPAMPGRMPRMRRTMPDYYGTSRDFPIAKRTFAVCCLLQFPRDLR